MRPLSPSTSAKLFATGFTIGPLVDSLHNQCLLQYKILPIAIPWPTPPPPPSALTDVILAAPTATAISQDPSFLFCSSWTVPPLLGIAYVVLGGILPRLLESLGLVLQSRVLTTRKTSNNNDDVSSSMIAPQFQSSDTSSSKISTESRLRQKAWIAVATTALIIKLSEFLETHPHFMTYPGLDGATSSTSEIHFVIMLLAALTQWAWLDQTMVGLLAASITMVGGPLSELPFVAYGIWDYLPAASDYLPLSQWPSWLDSVATATLGEGYRDLALSSITGPCYFAVTMDAIALGRWFDSGSDSDKNKNE